MWQFKPSNRFKSSYKRLSNELANAVDDALKTLSTEERPERLGIPKMSSRKGYFAWEFGRSCRLLYRPDYANNILELLRVCSHKEAYEP